MVYIGMASKGYRLHRYVLKTSWPTQSWPPKVLAYTVIASNSYELHGYGLKKLWTTQSLRQQVMAYIVMAYVVIACIKELWST